MNEDGTELVLNLGKKKLDGKEYTQDTLRDAWIKAIKGE